MKKVMLFSHSDLDGVGCVIVGKKVFGEKLDFQMLGYHQINESVEQFIKNNDYKGYDEVYITDISVSEDVGELLEGIKGEIKVTLIDHHVDALKLNKYSWSKVITKNEKGKTSGTSLFFNLLKEEYSVLNELEEFVEKVRRYDSWEWNDIYNDFEAKKLNDYYYLIGRKRFVERYLDFSTPLFNEMENLLMEIEYEKMNDYVKWKLGNVRIVKFEEKKIGVVLNEQYPNEVASAILDSKLHIDLVALVNGVSGGVSLRSKEDGVNLIANQFGGGGHPRASGFGLSEDKKKKMINLVFQS
ncbi:DHH family phosphoesterase [Virgibacillus sp. DJP39]|uniref:DHH family phosphoesterase n=1 Tax=Virgibacillus sp. DJP39 TaxID=3409790 RepID=UPI003BB6FF95